MENRDETMLLEPSKKPMLIILSFAAHLADSIRTGDSGNGAVSDSGHEYDCDQYRLDALDEDFAYLRRQQQDKRCPSTVGE